MAGPPGGPAFYLQGRATAREVKMRLLTALMALIAAAAAAQPSVFGEGSTGTEADLSPLRSKLAGVTALDGGDFGVLAMDMVSEETVSSGGGDFDIGNPDIFLLPMALERVREGELSLDYLIGPSRSLEDVLIVAGTGNDEFMMKLFSILEPEQIGSWMAAAGLSGSEVSGVFLEWEDAPVPLPNESTLEDCALVLPKMDGLLSSSIARRVLVDPLNGNPVMEGYDDDFLAVYGISSVDAAGSSRCMIVVYPDGRRVGLALLADQLCCEERADVALRMALDALAEL